MQICKALADALEREAAGDKPPLILLNTNLFRFPNACLLITHEVIKDIPNRHTAKVTGKTRLDRKLIIIRE